MDAALPPELSALKAARIRAGQAIRDLSHAYIGRDASLEQVEHLAASLEQITAQLWPQASRDRTELLSASINTDVPHGNFTNDFDDRPVSGRASPYGLDLDLHRHGDEIEALVTLRSAHEGAPGRSHGGIVAALFDDVFGYVLGIIQVPAFTGDLYIRYQAPTPILKQLSCRVRKTGQERRKITMEGELTEVDTGTVVATAKATFIAVDLSAFETSTAERPAPPDEGASAATS